MTHSNDPPVTADCGVPLAALLSSASMHDSLTAIPLSLTYAFFWQNHGKAWGSIVFWGWGYLKHAQRVHPLSAKLPDTCSTPGSVPAVHRKLPAFRSP